jgi:hypothetical protein
MLVTVKAIMEKFAKFSPSATRYSGFNGVNPTLSETIKVLARDPNPHGRLNTVHSKVILV